MKNAEISIVLDQGQYSIGVDGRATFESAPPLRDIAKELRNDNVETISINLGACTGMDSTFMGVLAMIGLEARKLESKVEILNASDTNIELLHGLGVKKLFSFNNNTVKESNSDQAEEIPTKPVEAKEQIETVLDSHKTLMEVDENNVDKFEKVVEYAEKDLERLPKDS